MAAEAIPGRLAVRLQARRDAIASGGQAAGAVRPGPPAELPTRALVSVGLVEEAGSVRFALDRAAGVRAEDAVRALLARHPEEKA